MTELQKRDLRYVWHPCTQMKDHEKRPPVMIERGRGISLFDAEGKEYLDVTSSWWCNLLGHCHPRINDAVKRQLDKLEHAIFADFTHPAAGELCERLSKILPRGLTRFNFSDNGSASVECALKMSFQYHLQTGRPEKTRFMALSGGYHGETLGALSVCGAGLYSKIYGPLLADAVIVSGPDCYRCPYGKNRGGCDAECFEHAAKALEEHGGAACAFIVEPLLQGAAGMRIYPGTYLKKLSAACRAKNVHLIADEIAAGFGRTGEMFACLKAGITPDIMCLSKGLTGGYMPMALTVATDEIYSAFYADYGESKAFLHSHTYSGNPLGCAAALEVLNVLEDEKILENAALNAAYMKNAFDDAFSDCSYVGEIRSIGLINAVEIVKDPSTKTAFEPSLETGRRIYAKALDKGLMLRPLGDVLYFNPPLVIDESDIERATGMFRESVREVLG